MELWENVFRAAGKSILSLLDVAPVKLVLAGALAFASGSQGTALTAFIALVLLDLVTKWMALTYKCLADAGAAPESIGLGQCVLGMPRAFKLRYITSEMMKTKFAGKLVLYMILVFVAVHVDAMAGGQGVFLKAAWYYLAATEALSIVENLRDAGVQSLDPLLTFIRAKLGGLK